MKNETNVIFAVVTFEIHSRSKWTLYAVLMDESTQKVLFPYESPILNHRWSDLLPFSFPIPSLIENSKNVSWLTQTDQKRWWKEAKNALQMLHTRPRMLFRGHVTLKQFSAGGEQICAVFSLAVLGQLSPAFSCLFSVELNSWLRLLRGRLSGSGGSQHHRGS